jgi:hypothetical protein
MGAEVVRAGAGIVFFGLLQWALFRRARLLPWLREYFLAPVPPGTLGLLRFVLLALLWNEARMANPEWHAALPSELRAPPFGWEQLGSLPFDVGAVESARDLLVVVSAAAALGLFTRVTVPLSALLAVYVLGVPQCFGKVNHGGHARMLAVLALSLAPSGDAFSLDSLFRRLRGQPSAPPSAAYALPVRAIWLLIGTTYLFPGLWKLLESGDLWITGEQLRFELYRRWGSAPDFRPLVRPDLHPWSLPLLGTATLVLEVGFIFAMFERRTRVVAALGAFGFHLGVAGVMGIRFPPYVPLLVLIEAPHQWGAWGKRCSEGWEAAMSRVSAWLSAQALVPRLSAPSHPFPPRGAGASAVLCGTLLAAQFAAGVTQTSSWPISVFPTFSSRKTGAAARPQSTRIVLETTSGTSRELGPVLQRARVASATRMIEGIANRVTDRAVDTRGREVVELFRHLGIEVEPGDHLVLVETEWDLFPIGKREGLRSRTARRFLVRDDGTLSRLRPDRRPELALNDRSARR